MSIRKILNTLFFIMCLFVFIFNYNDTLFLGIPAYTWTNLTVVAYMGFSLYKVLKLQGGTLKWNGILTWFLLFVVACFISISYSYARNASISRTLRMFELFIMCIAIYQQLDSKDNLDTHIMLYVWAGTLAAIYLMSFSDRTQRIGDVVGDANQIGITFAFAATMALYLLKKKKKIIYLLSISVLTIAILLTGSRAALILIVLSIISNIYISAFQNRWSFLKVIVMTIVIVGILVGGLYMILNVESLYRTIGIRVLSFYQITNGKESVYHETSTFTRMKYMQSAFEWFLQSPIWGHGINSYQAYNRDFVFGVSAFSHCDYVELLSALGIIGAVIFFCPFLFFLRPMFSRGTFNDIQLQNVLMFSLSAEFLIGEIFLVMYYEKEIWILIPMLIRMYEISKAESMERKNVIQGE